MGKSLAEFALDDTVAEWRQSTRTVPNVRYSLRVEVSDGFQIGSSLVATVDLWTSTPFDGPSESGGRLFFCIEHLRAGSGR